MPGGKTVGRVAAFFDRETWKKTKGPVGGIGFFECINDVKIAHDLLKTAQAWLNNKQITVIEAPINFGHRDQWWGLLVENFDSPSYQMSYNPRYYQEFFESYGLRPAYKQFAFLRNLRDPIPEKSEKMARDLMANPDYSYKSLRNLSLQTYARDCREIYNLAWANREGARAMSDEDMLSMIKKLRPIMDPDLLWVAYYKNKPAAFLVAVPAVNEIVRHMKGRTHLLGKIKFAYHRYFTKRKRITGLAYGIVPSMQGRGITSGFMLKVIETAVPKKNYEDFELTWIGDFNTKMLSLAETLGTKKHRTFITYRLQDGSQL